MYNICWWFGGGSLTVDTRLNRILSRCQLCGESKGQRSCNGSKSNGNWLHGGETVGLVLLQIPHGRRSCFIHMHFPSSWSRWNGVSTSSHRRSPVFRGDMDISRIAQAFLLQGRLRIAQILRQSTFRNLYGHRINPPSWTSLGRFLTSTANHRGSPIGVLDPAEVEEGTCGARHRHSRMFCFLAIGGRFRSSRQSKCVQVMFRGHGN